MKDFFKNIPTLHTERLTLRKISPRDAEDMYGYSRDPAVTEYLLWDVHADLRHTVRYIRAVQKYYAKGLFYDWAVVDNESGRMIGTCGFARIDEANRCAELGYVLHRDFWGRGYAAEAARAVISVGFNTLDLKRIEARYMIDNFASARVMEKLGMRYEGIKRAAIFVKGAFRDIGYYSILQEEF
ncbi:MAG: GNAT family N-acetyltransferase [Clostridia bacterium]|nr:GNAT family N-acetyltransferase [Clostridia bacterium]